MNTLDWVLVVMAAVYALAGFWQGFIAGLFATVGLLGGGALGVWLAPKVLGNVSPSVGVSLGALFIVIVGASVGQGVLHYVGAKVRDRVQWKPARYLDALGGAVLNAGAALLVCWALGVAVSGAHLGAMSNEVRSSAVLGKIDSTLPPGSSELLNSFDNVVGTSFFPRYLEPFAPERIVAIGPGSPAMLRDPDVVRAGQSVVKIRGANVCGRGVEGTGFVIAPGYLMTNAHVVAGVGQPQVQLGTSSVAATTVAYDPDTDIAILHFYGSAGSPLHLVDSATPGEGVAVIGYPEDGPYDMESARIRSQQRLRSPNIYGRGTVIRDVYAVRGLIRPGNSGGPLVDDQGQVVGVVFAASVTDPSTGYALTASQVRGFLADVGKTEAVPTGNCAG